MSVALEAEMKRMAERKAEIEKNAAEALETMNKFFTKHNADSLAKSEDLIAHWLVCVLVALLVPGASQIASEFWQPAAGPVQVAWVWGFFLWGISIGIVQFPVFSWAFVLASGRMVAMITFIVLTGNVATYDLFLAGAIALCYLLIVMMLVKKVNDGFVYCVLFCFTVYMCVIPEFRSTLVVLYLRSLAVLGFSESASRNPQYLTCAPLAAERSSNEKIHEAKEKSV